MSHWDYYFFRLYLVILAAVRVVAAIACIALFSYVVWQIVEIIA